MSALHAGASLLEMDRERRYFCLIFRFFVFLDMYYVHRCRKVTLTTPSVGKIFCAIQSLMSFFKVGFDKFETSN